MEEIAMNAMNNDRELKNRPSSHDGRFRKPLSRWTRSHPRLWGWSTAILSIALPILAIVCGPRWGNWLLSCLLLVPLVIIWPGITVKVLEHAVTEHEKDVHTNQMTPAE